MRGVISGSYGPFRARRDHTLDADSQLLIFEESKHGQPLPIAGLRKIIVSGMPIE
jgi:hypothetical protein